MDDLIGSLLATAIDVLAAIALGAVLRRLLDGQPGRIRSFLVAFSAILVMIATVAPIATALGLPTDPTGRPGLEAAWVLVLVLHVLATTVAALGVLVLWEIVIPTGSLPGPVEAAIGLRDAVRRALRYAELSWVAASSGLWRRARLGPADPAFAEALVRTLERSGPTFVKVGQILSTRVEDLPPALSTELARLQSGASPVSAADIASTLRDAWGAAPTDRLASFDPVPLAAASLAQVHAAELVDGTRVVVKVRRPGAATRVRVDADILVRFAAEAERRWAWARGMGLAATARGLRGSLLEELDYRIEARNTELIARSLADRPAIAVPRTVPELSGDRVLVMTRLDGATVSAATGIDDARREALARELAAAVLGGVLTTGVFHADLHPGNVLVLDDGRLGLLDLGAIGIIDAETRELLGALLLAVLQDDAVAALAALELAFDVDEGADRTRMRRELGRLVTRSRYAGDVTESLVAELFSFLARHGVTVPGDVAGAFRTVVSMLGALRALAPAVDADALVRETLPELVRRTLDPERRGARGLTRAALTVTVANRVPGRVERITSQLADGTFTVRARSFADVRDRAWVATLLDDLASAVFATALLATCVWLLTTDGGPLIGETLPLFSVLAVVAGIGGFALAFRLVIRLFRSRGRRRDAP